MKGSKYFLRTEKNLSKEENKSYGLMSQAGLIKQNTAGIYTWLPLGTRVLSKLQAIIKKLHEREGVIEIITPPIQPASLWFKSGRFSLYGKEMLKIKDRNNKELVYAPTSEELITATLGKNIRSYKELPKIFYNIQSKFRDEIRPSSGVIRSREFIMKDAYSFDIDEEQALKTYEKMFTLYELIFDTLNIPYLSRAAAAGEIGGSLSHEFHIPVKNAEDQICSSSNISHKKNPREHLPTKKLPEEINSIEIGHLFYFGNKYSKIFEAFVLNHQNQKQNLMMGSYGIGITRLIGAIVEANYDEKGIKWPLLIAPFAIGLINLKTDDSLCFQIAETIYQMDNENIYFDDQIDKTTGEKICDAELVGFPYMFLIGNKFIEEQKIEMRKRGSRLSKLISLEEVANIIYDIQKSQRI